MTDNHPNAKDRTGGLSEYDGLLHPDVPMHHQIYMQLRNEIEDGLWAGRSEFPGEEELANRFNVSIITSRRALIRLSEEGLVKRERGRRPKVNYDFADGRHESAPTMFPLGGQPFEYRVLSAGVAIVPAEACQAFGLAPGSSMWTCARLRIFQGRRHSFAQNVQRPDDGSHYQMEELARYPMAQLIAARGIKLVKLRRRLSIALPSAAAARSLEISLHDRTLVYTYVLLDGSDRVIEWVRIYIHPNEPLPFETMNLENHTWETLEVV